MQKEITVAFYGRRFLREDWTLDLEREGLDALCASLAADYASFGIVLRSVWEEEVLLDVRGYADLLNCIRLRSPADGIANLCLGHVIGQSAHCDPLEDLRRGVSRVAFAPEMIEPEGENKRVCHNCGCGC